MMATEVSEVTPGGAAHMTRFWPLSVSGGSKASRLAVPTSRGPIPKPTLPRGIGAEL